ncbi:hypothetical protein BABINDRAFT_163704 [Babjeviella inositovora NRRL Y-12698]|uniref:Amino acid permease/ SLC12A domain-containing protein n=1 Tax=Babjeviella inositovora NRRL Y-12698 TaxID=984486 RepID=A0A1E3QHM5_9ASCO|nr:uncharacterized protein BABINDRAFT_163704 [Babjeviella inositovora NRRL Y-12698]ODQ77196.1 hypothetical protein BABINDRAFT_163704 [Babjeviella inositovora NRRL Y-12698]
MNNIELQETAEVGSSRLSQEKAPSYYPAGETPNLSHSSEKKTNPTASSIQNSSNDEDDDESFTNSTAAQAYEHQKTQRQLKSRHIQLIAIGGSIGTGLFVTIATGLTRAGPLGLLIAVVFWTTVILALTSMVAEMVCYMPVASPFISMSGRVVDEAYEVTAGWNFFLMEACYIPFEITAVNGMIHFWRDDYSPAITLCIQIVIYTGINVFAVKWYGESEFWLSIGKLVLCIGLLIFTLVSMCGGNPSHDAFGFRYWKNPGLFGTYVTTGGMGRFQGWLAALSNACFFVVGPEYMSMAAGECENPRKVLPVAYKTVIYRLALFYIGGALSVGILVAYNDPVLLEKLTSSSSNSAASPYVIAMQNMGIKVLPHIVNGLVLSAAFSAGNSYLYCSSRSLYALALKGYAPKVLRAVNGQGVPYYCVAIGFCFSCLALLQLGSSASVVLDWIVNLCTGAQMLNYAHMCVTYLSFYRAMKAQGIDRNGLPYRAWFQPYSSYYATFFIWIMVFILGYTVFMPGWWSVENFLFSYLMIFINIAIFVFWKVLKRTKFIKPEEVDFVWGLDEIEEHEYEFYAKLEAEGKSGQPETWWSKIMVWLF